MGVGNQIKIQYFGTNVGKIYLSDIGKRLGLGGGKEGGYGFGQDQYIMWGETLVIQGTGEALMSATSGVIYYFSTTPASGVWINGAPLIVTQGTFANTADVPLRDVAGDTGRFTDTYLSKLSDKYTTGAVGSTGYFYGNTNTPGITGATA